MAVRTHCTNKTKRQYLKSPFPNECFTGLDVTNRQQTNPSFAIGSTTYCLELKGKLALV